MKTPSTSSVKSVTDLLPSGSTFMRGLAIGAMVGAAIAGSTIWERHRAKSRLRELAASTASKADALIGDEPGA